MITPIAGGTVVDALITLILATSFLIVGGRRVDTAIRVIVTQGVLLTAVTVTLGLLTGGSEMYFAALLTLVVKAGLIPYVLHKVQGRVQTDRETKSFVNIKMSLVICSALVVLAAAVTRKVLGDAPILTATALPTAVSMMLIGLFIMVSRKLAIMQILGLLIMENGIYLAGIGTATGLPLVVELGIFLDILVGVLIMGILTFRINQTFDHVDTDNLKNLRG
jgi:hydrogenase-4 membrane subunit HyfE